MPIATTLDTPPGDAPTPPTAPAHTPTPAPTRRLPLWTREPLLHFVLAGAVLFGLDHLLVTRADDPRTIVIGLDVDKEARELFKSTRGQDPTPEQLAALRQVWLDNEVLYREGLALQVDKGDDAIRERVIFKALSVVDANTRLPQIDEAGLRRWFEAHRAKYDDPARLDFEEAVMEGQAAEDAVRAFVRDLNAGTPGDARAGLRVFKARPLASLAPAYGEPFARQLQDGTPGQWAALKANDGWHAVRVTARSPARPAHFEALANVVKQDWTDATMSEQRSAAVAALARKYRIRIESAAR